MQRQEFQRRFEEFSSFFFVQKWNKISLILSRVVTLVCGHLLRSDVLPRLVSTVTPSPSATSGSNCSSVVSHFSWIRATGIRRQFMAGGVGGGLVPLAPPLHLSFIHPLAPRRGLHRPRHLICTPTHLGSHFPSLLSPSLFSYLFHPFLSPELHHPPTPLSLALSYPPLPRPHRRPIDR